MTRTAFILALLVTLTAACQPEDPEEEERHSDTTAEPASSQDAFWENLRKLCESAHEGELLRAPQGDTQVDPDARLVVHFQECGDRKLRFPFHVDGDRSRTWFLFRHQDRLELRHDHRNEDGTEAENTWYGAFTRDEGTPHQQEFLAERDGAMAGWRIEIRPGVRFTYGTIRNGEWRHHLEFDLSREVNPPPLPWGYETQPAALR